MSIKGLDANAPADTQEISQGALRIRETRNAVKTVFPEADKPILSTSDQMNNTFTHGGFVVGMTIDWQGAIGSIPMGWALSDGGSHNGVQTLDLRGKFTIGYDVRTDQGVNSEYDTIGKTGGTVKPVVPLTQHNHTGSTNNDGSHTHTTLLSQAGGSSIIPSEGAVARYSSGSDLRGSATSTTAANTHVHNFTTANTGTAGATLDVRSPYTVLAKIVYVGPSYQAVGL